jgi:sterol desaturase/sphingolipid hydroxylase (fatty acid hydroxylase superfamily)
MTQYFTLLWLTLVCRTGTLHVRIHSHTQAIWATNIHDALDGNTEPILGSKYHTMHHTHYHVNFGQFFIFCDWYWDTLRDPNSANSSNDSSSSSKAKLIKEELMQGIDQPVVMKKKL